jgi:hypothetical protein
MSTLNDIAQAARQSTSDAATHRALPGSIIYSNNSNIVCEIKGLFE